MFYHNTRYHFKLADQSPDTIAGGIVAASALPRSDLLRRERKALKQHPYLQHRLFDPQLYLADIDATVASSVVAKLGTYPWFRCAPDEPEGAKQKGSVTQSKAELSAHIVAAWPRAAAVESASIAGCVRSCIELQQKFGCEAIILPSPMTRVPGPYITESQWIDTGLDACRDLRVSVPVYATVAIADTALRQQAPGQSRFLQAVSAQIAARPTLAGAYVVFAQETEDGYCCKVPDTLLSLLLLTDDLVRGAGREVIVNYMGTFGAVARAAGAKVWATGFYRSQRRLRSSDMDDATGRQFPRYYSTRLLGDIGVEEHLDLIAAHAVRDRVLVNAPSSQQLNDVLRRGGRVSDVAQWQYRSGNFRAAAAHYNTLMHQLGTALEGVEADRRLDVMNKLLVRAEHIAEQVKDATIRSVKRTAGPTDTGSQRIWRATYESWRNLSGV